MKKTLVATLLAASALCSQPLFADNEPPKLTLYTTEWQIYDTIVDGEIVYPGYSYDGSYTDYGAWHNDNTPESQPIKNDDMIAQFQYADVIPFSFMQVWNHDDPNQAKYLDPKNIGSSWDGILHFSDLYADLTYFRGDDSKTCTTLGTASCAAVQLNTRVTPNVLELFQYLEDPTVGGRGAFKAFINSTKYNTNINGLGVKRILAIGGANTTQNHSVSDYTFRALFDSKKRDQFLASLKRWKNAYPNIKGLDFDFEPPINADGSQVPVSDATIADYKNLLALVKATRDTMKSIDPYFYISVTITSNLDYLEKIKTAGSNGGNWYTELYPIVDSLNIMTYDLHGPWSEDGDPLTAIHSALTQTSGDEAAEIQYGGIQSIQTVLDMGFGANKLQMGIPEYGRAFAGVKHDTKMANLPGYYASWTHMATIDELGNTHTTQKGFLPYKSVKEMTEKNGYLQQNVIDPISLKTNGGYIYNPGDGTSENGIFIGYETPEEVVSVCNFIKNKGLKGVIMWSVDTDLPVSNPASLIASYRDAGC